MKFYRQAAWDEPLLNAMGRKGRKGISMPKDQFPSSTLRIPDRLLRKEIPLPNLSQIEVVRHFTHLSQMNFSIDSGMYPLGSCTMKYNPKLASRIATDRKITGLHPYQDERTIQGILEILYRLSFYLAEITGMSRVSLAPSAGAHAEFVGGLIIRKYLQ
ncbi:MAG: aminomethyl-transferring glycine dehydrogenase subunit GcvPB, partial [Nitrososphaerales archaeon]